MRRSWPIWIGFVLCFAAVLAAMAWVSLTAVRLDWAEADARRQAALQERVLPALWRADSVLAPMVASESVRPWFAYRALFPADQSYSRMFNNERPAGNQRLVPSPLLTSPVPKVVIYFQFEPDGRLTSPQVPSVGDSKLAAPLQVPQEAVEKARAELERWRVVLDREQLIARLPEHPVEPVQLVLLPAPPPNVPSSTGEPQPPQPQPNPSTINVQPGDQQGPNPQIAQSPLAQSREQREIVRNRRAEMQRDNGKEAVEYDIRQSLLLGGGQGGGANFPAQVAAQVQQFNDANRFYFQNGLIFPSTDISGVAMTPLWIGDALVLARRVVVSGKEYVQGCVLDWPAIKAVLLEEIADLLPEADFEPAPSPLGDESRLLAALPVRLVPGSLSLATDGTLSPILLSLAVAWACVALAALAIAGLLSGVIRLSERRASFVTAVTHELRTPLTTFQMYAEMLAEGMVSDAAQQRQYLTTLRAESVRLTHLVENVLSYARLERGRVDGRRESLPLGRLIERVEARLSGRAEGAGMELVIEGEESAREALVRANPSAVEQILFNLVDNACKYAAGAADKRIELAIEVDGQATAAIRLRDHGPGLCPSVRRRLFRPFSKTAHEAAHSAPGVGLGLALSRRLARDMGGDLRLHPCDDGGCFTLLLPLAGDGA